MSSSKFAELSAGTCLHCGLRTVAPVCPRCDAETGIADARPTSSDTVRVGFVGRGGSASPTIWIVTSSDSTQYTSAGRVLPVDEATPKGFVSVQGIESVRCETAAALAVSDRGLVDGLGGGPLETALIAHRLAGGEHAGRVASQSHARRSACELAGAGCRRPIGLLPLSAGEIAWWSALAALRAGQRDEAVAHLAELPPVGYDVAVVILRWAAERWVGDAAAKAKFLVERRLQGTPSQRLGKVSLACGSSPIEQFLLDPDHADRSSLSVRPDSAPSVTRALALSAVPIDGQLSVGSTVSAAVLDDLIDLDVPIDPSTLSADQRRQMLARTRPDALTDAEVAAMHLDFERDRRTVINGSFEDLDMATTDAHIRAIVRLHTDSTVTAELRTIDPGLCDQLAVFLAKPSAATLTVDLVRDPSLWSLLARRLDVPVSSWPADPGSPTQPFVGWIALRATFARLTAGDWAAAARTGEHAIRLAADEVQRREAINCVAFALWQHGDRDAAAATIRSASGVDISRAAVAGGQVGPADVATAINHALIVASGDDSTAAAELGRLIDIGGTTELGAAAAMHTLRRWTSDDLPWTSRSARPPAALISAMRDVVVQTTDLALVRALLAYLSNVDRDWVARSANLAQSSVRSTSDVRVYQARATGPREFVDALTYALRSSDPPAWVSAERDAAIAIAVRRVFDDDGSSALFALFTIERSMPVTADQRAALAPLAVLAVCAQSDSDEAPPEDGYRQLLVDADIHYRDRPCPLHVRHLLAAAWEQLGHQHAVHIQRRVARMHRSTENIVDQAARQGRQRRSAHLAELAMEPILHDAELAVEAINEFRAHVASTPVAGEFDDVMATIGDIRRRAEQLRRGRFDDR